MRRKYTRTILEKVVKESLSLSNVCRLLDVPNNGGTRSVIKKRIVEYNIDTSHFTGQAHLRGGHSSNKLSADAILIYGGTAVKASQLRRALMESGREYICEECNSEPRWNNKPLVLQVDHKNGDRKDNTKENLRFLCPNCHTQTSNWGIKNYMLTIVK